MIVETILLIDALLLVVGLAMAAYYRYSRVFTYWEQFGVKMPTYPSCHPLGNSCFTQLDSMTQKVNIADIAVTQYREPHLAGEKVYGTFMLCNPCLVVKDPDLIKQVLVKDFHHFIDRTSDAFIKKLSGKTLTDRIWTKALTTIKGKLKAMTKFIAETSQQLIKSFDKDFEAGQEVDVKSRFNEFSMDTISSCAFGIKTQTLSNEDKKFILYAKEYFRKDMIDFAKFIGPMIPGVKQAMDFFGIAVFKAESTMFFFDVVKRTVEHRIQAKERRNDFIDLMIDVMRDPEDITAEKDPHIIDHKTKKKDFDLISLAATAIVMLVGGFETTGNTLGILAWALATNPNVQRKLQEEVDEAVEANGGNLPDYNETLEMEYLDMVMQETVRCYPPIPVLARVCNEDWDVPGYPGLKITRDQEVHVNMIGIHMDPKYFPNPEQFDPERFSRENRAKRHPFAFLPFSHGPRACIGMRFANVAVKHCVVAVMASYTFVRSERTPERLSLDPCRMLGVPKGELWVRLERRN